MEAMPEIEWNAFNTGIYTTEEADFMAQLLGNCSLPNELPGISSFGLPSSSATTFCTGRESAMNQSVIYSYSDNNTNPPNVYSFSQGSSYNYQYQYQELSDDQSLQFLAMNDSSMSIDFCTGEDRNTGSSPVEVHNDSLMEGDECLNQEMSSGSGSGSRDESGRNLQISREPEMAVLETSAEEKNDSLLLDKKRSRVSGDLQRKRNVKSRKNQKVASANNNDEDNNNGGINRQASSSCCSEEEYSNNASQEQLNNNGGGVTSSSNSKGAAATLNLNGESRASRGSATDPQSLYARKRRERINEKLRILQHLVPNGTKVDISTMLEEAVQYVKFLQLQIKLLSSDDLWMYAPIAHNGMDIGRDLKITTPR